MYKGLLILKLQDNRRYLSALSLPLSIFSLHRGNVPKCIQIMKTHKNRKFGIMNLTFCEEESYKPLLQKDNTHNEAIRKMLMILKFKPRKSIAAKLPQTFKCSVTLGLYLHTQKFEFYSSCINCTCLEMLH